VPLRKWTQMEAYLLAKKRIPMISEREVYTVWRIFLKPYFCYL
jgi:hypothetical protein